MYEDRSDEALPLYFQFLSLSGVEPKLSKTEKYSPLKMDPRILRKTCGE